PRGQRRSVAPGPADRDAGVVQVVDVVVGDPVVRTLTDPHADGLVEGVAAVVDVAVFDDVARGPLRPFGTERRLAAVHTPGSQVVEMTPSDDVATAAAAQLDRIVADMGNRAALEAAVPDPLAPQGAGDLDGRLLADRVVPRRPPLGVGEGQTAEGDVLDEPPRLRPARQADQLRQGRPGRP